MSTLTFKSGHLIILFQTEGSCSFYQINETLPQVSTLLRLNSKPFDRRIPNSQVVYIFQKDLNLVRSIPVAY